MFSLLPLWETETMMPMPIRIATPINVQAVPILCSIPNFQRAAMTPPIRTMKPTRYMPAHFIDHTPDIIGFRGCEGQLRSLTSLCSMQLTHAGVLDDGIGTVSI